MSFFRRLFKKKSEEDFNEVETKVIDGHKLRFIESHSFVGVSYSFVIDGNCHGFGFDVVDEEVAKQKTYDILTNQYGVNIEIEDINFQWDGTL